MRTRTLPELPNLRVGIVRGPWWDRAEPEAAAMLESVADQLSSLADAVESIDMPEALANLQDSHASLQSLEAGWYLREMIAKDPSGVSDLLKGHIAAAQAMTADEVQFARVALRDAREFVAAAFASYDVLITLAAPGEAPGTLEITGDPAFNRLASTAGVPAAGLPVGVGAHGMPLGLQIMAPKDADQALMELVCTLTHKVGLASVPALPAG